MATLQESITRIGGSNSYLGTGNRFQDINLKDLKHVIFLPKGTKIPLTDTFDLDYFETLQTNQKAFVLKDAYEFIDNTTENSKQTSGTGYMKVGTKGKYAFSFKFDTGFGLFKALESFESNGELDVLLVDSTNNWMFTSYLDTHIKGFSTTYTSSELIKFSNGSDSTSKVISFQLKDYTQIDVRGVILHNDKSLFHIDDVEGVNQLVYSLNAVPASGATTVSVKVESMVNKDADISSLISTITSSVKVNVNGVNKTISSVVDAGNNVVTVTFTGALTVGQKVYVYATPFKVTDAGLFQAERSEVKVVV